jgi:AAA15 family ATPase/GTPase
VREEVDIYEIYDEYLLECPRGRWIAFQNFQGFRSYTKIPLAPITLIYGQNSAGKSTIQDAIFFANKFFSGEWNHEDTVEHLDRWANNKRNSPQPNKNYIGNEDDVIIELGGFFNNDSLNLYKWSKDLHYDNNEHFALDLIYGITSKMPISFRVHFGNAVNGWNLKELVIYIGKDIFMHYKFWGDKFNNTFFGDRTPSEDDGCFSDEAPDRGPDDYVLPDSSLAFNIQHPAYNFLIRESFSENCINGIFVGYPILNNKWFILDRLGLLLTCDNHENVMETPYLCWKNIIAWGYYEEYDYRSNKQDDFTNSTRNLISHLICFPVFSLLEDDLEFKFIAPIRKIPTKEESTYGGTGKGNYEDPISSLVDIIRKKVLDEIYFEEIDIEEKTSEEKSIISTLTNLLELSFELAEFEPKLKSKGNQSDPLINIRSDKLGYINNLLTDPLFLNTDYEIVGNCQFIIPQEIIPSLVEKSKKEIRSIFENLNTETHICLRYIPDNSLVEFEDVGVGISQVIPVLLASNYRRAFIQQPELHLHPKLQAQLADVFVIQLKRSYSAIFIIESHSEHFLLRLLRRIRETYKSDLPFKFSLKPEDVAVLYVDKTKEGISNLFHLRISNDGEFIDRWPNGFFTERDGELFDE